MALEYSWDGKSITLSREASRLWWEDDDSTVSEAMRLAEHHALQLNRVVAVKDNRGAALAYARPHRPVGG